MKTCVTCGESKPATPEYFNWRDRHHKDFRGKCRECHQAYAKDWKAKSENKNINRRKYTDDEVMVRVEDDEYKIRNVPCRNNDEGCKNVMKVLLHIDDRTPVRYCATCKSLGRPSDRTDMTMGFD